MAICNDCVHSGICAIQLEPHYVLDRAQKLMRESNNVEHECLSFKDRSRFVELPCLPGDEMFLVSFYADKISKYKVFSMPMMIAKNNRWFIINLENQRGAILGDFHFSDIGKTIFLTREEAEQALAKQNQPDNTPQ